MADRIIYRLETPYDGNELRFQIATLAHRFRNPRQYSVCFSPAMPAFLAPNVECNFP